jgi:ribonuclease VapC
VILDSSAVVAIVLKEPDYPDLLRKIDAASTIGMGTPTLVETGIVLAARLGPDGRSLLAQVVQDFQIVPVPFGEAHWREAVSAYERFGRGRHPAALNFGDCMSYSTARLADLPLLFTGNDFAQTDVRIG